MSTANVSYDVQALNRATRDAWNQNAEVWDKVQGDTGNHYQRLLVAPATERLL